MTYEPLTRQFHVRNASLHPANFELLSFAVGLLEERLGKGRKLFFTVAYQHQCLSTETSLLRHPCVHFSNSANELVFGLIICNQIIFKPLCSWATDMMNRSMKEDW